MSASHLRRGQMVTWLAARKGRRANGSLQGAADRLRRDSPLLAKPVWIIMGAALRASPVGFAKRAVGVLLHSWHECRHAVFLVQRGVLYNACSLHQLRAFGELCPGRELSIRANPGLGSGHNNRTNTS